MIIKKSRVTYYLILVLMYWCILQDFVLPIIYRITGSIAFVKLVFFLKDFIFIFLLVSSLKKFKGNKINILYIVYIAYCLIILIFSSISGANISSLLQNFRNVIIFPSFVIIGYNCSISEFEIKKIIRKVLSFLLICALFAIVEFFLDLVFGTKEFWTVFVNIGQYMIDIKGQEGRLVYNLPGNFYGSYGQGYFSVKRLVGFWASPLTAAYTLILPAIYYFLVYFENRKIYRKDHSVLMKVVVFFLAILFSNTRIIIVLLLCSVALYIANNVKKNPLLSTLIILIGIAMMIFTFDITKLLSYFNDASTVGHFANIIDSIKNFDINLFGHGIASAGASGNVGTESAYLTLNFNIGIIGFLLFAFQMLNIRLSRLFRTKTAINKACQMVFICLLVTGFISEQLLAYTSMFFPAILIGFAMKPNNREGIDL